MLMTGVAAFALAIAAAAGADTTGDVLTLNPVSHGAQTQASWRAQEGRPDSQGSANQALVLQAPGTADTSAAALFRGFEGVRVRELQSLSYQHRVPATCSKTDPRWTLFVRGKGAKTYLINLGCAVTPARPTDDPKWIERVFSQKVIQAEVVKQVPRPAVNDALGGTIEQLALVVDRTKGAAYLDNIAVRAGALGKIWTYAGDNGNGSPGGGPADFSADQLTMVAAPLSEEALWDEADVLASITPEEQALIDETNSAP
jgi:hypothetical protein